MAPSYGKEEEKVHQQAQERHGLWEGQAARLSSVGVSGGFSTAADSDGLNSREVLS